MKIYLPRLVGDDKEIKRTIAEPIRTGDRSEIILVVEDDPLMRRLTTEALHELGYTVFESENAANALAILDRSPISNCFSPTWSCPIPTVKSLPMRHSAAVRALK